MSRDVVITAAGGPVDTDGIEALTLTCSAESLAVTQPALCDHVRSGADSPQALRLLARQQLLAELRDAVVGRAKDDAVRAVADARRSVRSPAPRPLRSDRSAPARGLPGAEAGVQDIVMLLYRVAKGYGLSDDDAEHAAWSLCAALHGFVALEAQQGHPASLPLSETFSRLVLLLCSGLKRDATSSDLRTST
jgi:hypothetical protein